MKQEQIIYRIVFDKYLLQERWLRTFDTLKAARQYKTNWNRNEEEKVHIEKITKIKEVC